MGLNRPGVVSGSSVGRQPNMAPPGPVLGRVNSIPSPGPGPVPVIGRTNSIPSQGLNPSQPQQIVRPPSRGAVTLMKN